MKLVLQHILIQQIKNGIVNITVPDIIGGTIKNPIEELPEPLRDPQYEQLLE